MARSNGGIIGKVNKTSFGKSVTTVVTGSGCVTAQSGTRVIQATLVAGGASGGSNQGEGDAGGGGGAGGLTTFPSVNACGSISVIIGGGGALANYTCRKQGNPGNTSSVGTACVTGGGGGGAPGSPAPTTKIGLPGGSGGGSTVSGAVGTGICGQGNNGGVGLGPAGDGGGGGGAGAVGGNGTSYPGGTAGVGGAGTDVSPLYPGVSLPNSGVYAGGGGGASYDRNPGANCAGAGGSGGGGAGGKGAQVGTAGGTNTGGGGGGAGGKTPGGGGRNSGAGGPGIAIIKELNQANGVWSMQSQFQAIKQGTWPDGTVCAALDVDYLVVGAGGRGRGGGGGAGGYRTSFPGGTKATIRTAQGPYTITIGAGNGNDTVAFDGKPFSITSTGGGSGMSFGCTSGEPGGSGGGGTGQAPTAAGRPGGTGNDPPVSPPQGNPGGAGQTPYNSAGGGGACAAGTSAPSCTVAGNGGAGKTNCITGSPVRYADGGGGTNQNDSIQPGAGGLAGGPSGGRGAYASQSGGSPGAANTGGGAGGGWCSAGGTGGPGIVVVRVPGPTAPPALAVGPGCNTLTTHPGGDKIAKFTVTGTLTVS